MLEVIQGEYANKWVDLTIDSDSEEKAIQFAAESAKLETFNDKIVQFGGYEVYRRKWLVFWKLVKEVSFAQRLLRERGLM